MAIKDLSEILNNLKPHLDPQSYVFCVTDKEVQNAVMRFCEEEGATIIVEKTVADQKELEYSAVWRKITLSVNSDLEAVGLLAAVTKLLAENNIAVNAVSAFYHDHLFVLESDAEKALNLLQSIES